MWKTVRIIHALIALLVVMPHIGYAQSNPRTSQDALRTEQTGTSPIEEKQKEKIEEKKSWEDVKEELLEKIQDFWYDWRNSFVFAAGLIAYVGLTFYQAKLRQKERKAYNEWQEAQRVRNEQERERSQRAQWESRRQQYANYDYDIPKYNPNTNQSNRSQQRNRYQRRGDGYWDEYQNTYAGRQREERGRQEQYRSEQEYWEDFKNRYHGQGTKENKKHTEEPVTAPQKDYYKILGIQKNARPVEIKKAYVKLSLEYHPDKIQKEIEEANKAAGKAPLTQQQILANRAAKKDLTLTPQQAKRLEEANERYKKIVEAYKILSDRELRENYDRARAKSK